VSVKEFGALVKRSLERLLDKLKKSAATEQEPGDQETKEENDEESEEARLAEE
jgi:hypothetical protein